MNLNTYDYRKNQSYTTDRPATSAIGRGLSQRQEPCIPYALSRCTSEINGAYIGANWSADGYDPYISQFVGEAFRGRRRQGSGDASLDSVIPKYAEIHGNAVNDSVNHIKDLLQMTQS